MNVTIARRSHRDLRERGTFAFGAVVIVNRHSSTMIEFEKSEARTPRQMLEEITRTVEHWEREQGERQEAQPPPTVSPHAFIEMSEGFLNDFGEDDVRQQPGSFWAMLDVVECRVVDAEAGSMLRRDRFDFHAITGATREIVEEKIREFIYRPDVRLLAPGIETNTLPKEEAFTEELRDGTATIYQSKEAD